MAAGSKTAEIRAGIVVLIGLVILAIGLYLASGGGDRFREKSRLTIHFKDAGGIGNGADVFVAGQKAGQVLGLETVMFNHEGVRGRWVAVTIEIRKQLEIPIDSSFRISKSITNVVQLNIDYGTNNTLARETTEGLVGRRLANVDELVDSYQQLGGVARKAAEDMDALIPTRERRSRKSTSRSRTRRDMLAALRETATNCAPSSATTASA
jgi:ABC-type transporter Mla subunit MlaD